MTNQTITHFKSAGKGPSRRMVLRDGAALAVAGTVAVIPAVAGATEDAHLLRLQAEWRKADEASTAADVALDQIYHAILDELGADYPGFLLGESRDEATMERFAMVNMRGEVTGLGPLPENVSARRFHAQREAKWKRAGRTAEKDPRMLAAHAECNRARAEYDGLMSEIIATPAEGLTGIEVKLAVTAFYFIAHDGNGNFAADDELSDHDRLFMAALADVRRIGGAQS